jgi:hypothetical protein
MALFLTSTGADPNAIAKVTFSPRTGREMLKVELRKLEVGPYDLLVAGNVVATIQVRRDNSGGRETGKTTARSAERPTAGFRSSRADDAGRQGRGVFEDVIPSTADSTANVEFGIDSMLGSFRRMARPDYIRNGRMDFA